MKIAYNSTYVLNETLNFTFARQAIIVYFHFCSGFQMPNINVQAGYFLLIFSHCTLILLQLLQPFYGSMDFVRDKPGEPILLETFTHFHLAWSSIIPYLLPPSIFYNPWHPPCSMYVFDSLFPQSLSKFSLLYLLAWHPLLHTPYSSSPNHCLLFTAHAHTIATCFAIVPKLCHLIQVSLSTLHLELYLVA